MVGLTWGNAGRYGAVSHRLPTLEIRRRCAECAVCSRRYRTAGRGDRYTRMSGIGNGWGGGIAGASGDSKALDSALRRFIESDELRRATGLAARSKADKDLGIGQIVARTLSVYEIGLGADFPVSAA